MSRSGPQPWHGRYLWLHLQALGFQEAPPPPGKMLKPADLGEDMFDKPNRDAFYLVTHFLFSVLDPVRCKENFSHLWPPLDRKRDAEFRKMCCVWLKNISDECGSDFPPVVASLFLSPGGPKFIFLMYSFANYVILQKIKRDADEDFLFDAINTKPKDLETAVARNIVAGNRFLQVLQKQDSVIKQYQGKAQNLVRQIRDLRAESASLQTELLKFEKKGAQSENTACMVQSVRSTWGSIMESLTFLKKEKEVVDSVIKGHVDQYTLDGTDTSVNIPILLMDTITKDLERLQIDNIYEAGNLNLVTLVQLLNETLRVLIRERSLLDHKELKLDLHYIQEKAAFEKEVLSRLRHLRNGIRRETLISVDESIVEKQRDWHLKWEKELGQAPFHAINQRNPVLDLESPVGTFSFSPAPKAFLKTSVFCRFPPSLQDSAVRMSQRNANECSEPTPSGRFNSRTQQANFATSGSKSYQRQSEMSSYGGTPTLIPYGVKKEVVDAREQSEDLLFKARQQLVKQFADIVAGPHIITPERELEINLLLHQLSTDPFSGQKQILRTPESLILDVRRSWREAIQTEEVSELHEEPVRLSPASPDATNKLVSSHGGQTNSNKSCMLTDSHLPFPGDSLKNLSLDCDTSVPCESLANQDGGCGALKMTTNLVNETISFSTQSFTASEQMENSSFLDGDQMQTNVQKTLNRNDKLQPPLCLTSAHSTLSRVSSPRMGTRDELVSQELIDFGFPHNTQHTSLNPSNSLEPVVENRAKGKDPETNLYLQSIRSRLEKIKTGGRINSLEVKPSPVKILECDSPVRSPTETKLTLDSDYLETSSCTPLGRKDAVPRFSSLEEPYCSIEQEDLRMLEMQDSPVGVSQRDANEYHELTPSGRLNSHTHFTTPGYESHQRLSEMSPYGGSPTLTPYGMKNKRVDDLFLKAHQQIQQFAELVAGQHTPERKIEMDQLLYKLSSEQFQCRKQIPRNPESLILDVRSSWREAIQTEEVSELHDEPVRWSPAPPDATNELDRQEMIHFGSPHNAQDTSLLEPVDVAETRPKGKDPETNLYLKAVCSRLEEMKRATRKNSFELEDLYRSPARKIVKQKSASCLSIPYVENSDMFSPAETKFTLDLNYLENSPSTPLCGKVDVPLFSPFKEPFTSIEHEDLQMPEMQDYDPD